MEKEVGNSKISQSVEMAGFLIFLKVRIGGILKVNRFDPFDILEVIGTGFLKNIISLCKESVMWRRLEIGKVESAPQCRVRVAENNYPTKVLTVSMICS